MENELQQPLIELSLDEESKSNLSGIGQWAFINALVGFISLGVSILAAIIASNKPNAQNSLGTLVITVSVSLLLNITLFSASSHLKKGLADADQGKFNIGITKLASYFRILGIIIIILLAIFLLALIVGIMSGIGSFK